MTARQRGAAVVVGLAELRAEVTQTIVTLRIEASKRRNSVHVRGMLTYRADRLTEAMRRMAT